jgi:hypothetical protein
MAFIIPARCEEGAGSGVGEQRFLSAMRDAPDVAYILDDARRNGYPPGQQRAFVMAKCGASRVIIVASECPIVYLQDDPDRYYGSGLNSHQPQEHPATV